MMPSVVVIFAGTSGFSYDEWRGPFYPAELPDDELLRFYASKLPAVEINNTFYRLPRGDLLARWAECVPAGFRFVLKASRRITHEARLQGAGELVGFLWRSAARLGEALGPVLFQLPPYLRKDTARLAGFLAELPAGLRGAFEFRHRSWRDPEVTELLRRHGHALAVSDEGTPASGDGGPARAGDGPSAEIEATTDWGYLRLRADDYDDVALTGWRDRLRAQPWREAYVFFKHEEAGAAPRLALRFAALAAASTGAGATA
jgi:uncharacterized protein YecE (DUF72 family)